MTAPTQSSTLPAVPNSEWEAAAIAGCSREEDGCSAVEAATVLWAAQRSIPVATLDGDPPAGDRCTVLLVRPLGEPELRAIRKVHS